MFNKNKIGNIYTMVPIYLITKTGAIKYEILQIWLSDFQGEWALLLFPLVCYHSFISYVCLIFRIVRPLPSHTDTITKIRQTPIAHGKQSQASSAIYVGNGRCGGGTEWDAVVKTGPGWCGVTAHLNTDPWCRKMSYCIVFSETGKGLVI